MAHVISQLNWFSIFAAFIPYFILGALWFTVLFKKQYTESLGKTFEQQETPSPLFIIGPALCTLIITVTSAFLMKALGIDTYSETFQFAFVVGFGYLVANTVNIAINPNIPRPLYYGAISGCYHMVGIVIATSILYFVK